MLENDGDDMTDGTVSLIVASGGERDVTEQVRTLLAGQRDDDEYRVLLPIFARSDESAVGVERFFRTARALATDRDGEVLLLSVAVVPGERSLDDFRDAEAEELRRTEPAVSDAVDQIERLTERIVESAPETPVNGVVCVAHRRVEAVLDVVERRQCDALVACGSGEFDDASPLGRSRIDELLSEASCDVLVERAHTPGRSVERVLLAAGGGIHSTLTAEVARAFGRAYGAHIDAVHCLSPEATSVERQAGGEILDYVDYVVDPVEHIETELVETDDAAETIIDRAASYDVTIIGAPEEKSLLDRFVFGSVSEAITAETESTVVTARQFDDDRSVDYRWNRLLSEVDGPVADLDR